MQLALCSGARHAAQSAGAMRAALKIAFFLWVPFETLEDARHCGAMLAFMRQKLTAGTLAGLQAGFVA
jgi:hypothetical protein